VVERFEIRNVLLACVLFIFNENALLRFYKCLGSTCLTYCPLGYAMSSLTHHQIIFALLQRIFASLPMISDKVVSSTNVCMRQPVDIRIVHQYAMKVNGPNHEPRGFHSMIGSPRICYIVSLAGSGLAGTNTST